MALLLKNGAVFLHIPKTGGSWVSDALTRLHLVARPLAHFHADLQEALKCLTPTRTAWRYISERPRSMLPQHLKRAMNSAGRRALGRESPRFIAPHQIPFVFCFVRDPITWYESFWRYMTSRHWPLLGDPLNHIRWHPCSPLNGLGSNNFSTFMRSVNKHRPGFVTELYARYTLPGIGHVGRQESLEADLIAILRILGLHIDDQTLSNLPRINTSEKLTQATLWDPEVLEETRRTEYSASKRFGYGQ